MKYKKQIVAFIDVLGFSKLVHNSTVEEVGIYFKTIKHILNNKKAFSKTNTQFAIMSDAIVLWNDSNFVNFKTFVQQIIVLQVQLTYYKILTRGGIAIGNFYANKIENTFFGPALVKAYTLEQNAIYPRVILERGIHKQLDLDIEKFLNELDRTISKLGNSNYVDDYYYINYVESLIHKGNIYQGKLNNIKELFSENIYNDKVYPKYEWLRKNMISELKVLIDKTPSKLPKSKAQKSRFKKAPYLYDYLNEL